MFIDAAPPRRRVLAFTGIRSDYDLLSEIYKAIHADPDLLFGLIVSGAHLSTTYGYTVSNIENDQLPIIERIETLLDANSPSSRIKSASIFLQSCIQTISRFLPDVVIFAGDREDAMMAALASSYMGIPTIHFFGGDHTTDGNVDNPIRHAISKLASLHFVIHEEHKERLVSMGEATERVFIVGNPALDGFVSTPWMPKSRLLQELNCSAWDEYALVIFHPILGDESIAAEGLEDILRALQSKRIKAFVGYPNCDSGNRELFRVIENRKDQADLRFYGNCSRSLFINLMRHSKFLIGNSSSGIVEAPIIPLGVVNVGRRQVGRKSAGNVIFVEQDFDEISRGIDEVLSTDFKAKLSKVSSIYGDGNSTNKALHLIKTIDFSRYLRKTEDPLR